MIAEPRAQTMPITGFDRPPVLLCVDDEPNILNALKRLFRQTGWTVMTASGGAEGLRVLEAESVDLVISDMRMPEMDGAQFLTQVRQRWPETMRVLLTGYADMGSTINAINQGEIYRYIAKPWDDADMLLLARGALERLGLERERARLERLTQSQTAELAALNASLEEKVRARTAQLAAANERLRKNFFSSVRQFSNLLDLRGGPLAGHSRRVADLARRIGSKLSLPPADLQDLMLAGLLHDMGKIGMADDMCAKPVAQLHGDELVEFRRHPLRGQQALMGIEELGGAALLIRGHHERYDGRGYPDGLLGDAIPLGARILAVVNDYDGLMAGLQISQKLSAEEARTLIVRGAGERYDPAVIEAFVQVLDQRSASGSAAELVVGVEDLTPGMVLARDLTSPEGVLLLAADHVLDPALIRLIREFSRAEKTEFRVHVRNGKP